MSDATLTARRKAQLRVINFLLTGDPTLTATMTAFIAAVFRRPFTEYDAQNLTVKSRLIVDVLEQLLANVRKMPEFGTCEEVAAVMRDYKRKSTAPIHRNGGRPKTLRKPGDKSR